MSTSGFEQINATSLVDECHRQIKAQILAGELRPGEPLRDSVLAQKMGVSRSPVREALRLLEHSRLVVKAANRSYRVADVSDNDAEELAALRLADEGLAVRLIVRHRTPISSLQPVIDAIRDAEPGSIAVAEADTAFHCAVVELAGLPRLTARYADLTDQIRHMLAAIGRPRVMAERDVWRSHVALYEALERAIASGATDEVLSMWEAHVGHRVHADGRDITAV